MSVNVRARATSGRKVAFFWWDSISVREICGAQSFMGMGVHVVGAHLGNWAQAPKLEAKKGIM